MIIELLDAIENEPSRTGKQKILRRAASTPHFKTAVEYALHPYKRYFIRQLPKVEHPAKSKVHWGQVFDFLDKLTDRDITGDLAMEQCVRMSRLLSPGDAKVFQRILLKDLRCGVSTKIANSVYPKLVPEFNVQLAWNTYEPEAMPWPAIGDIKYDGMRVIAIVADEVEFLSRGGRAVKTMDHLKPTLKKLLGKSGGVLDGEAVSAGDAFEGAMSAAKRNEPKEGSPVSMVVFDMLTLDEWRRQRSNVAYEKRRGRLDSVFRDNKDQLLVRSRHVKLANDAAAQAFFIDCRKAGHEGSIIKSTRGLYEFKRTRAWMKMKASQTVDVEITGVIKGQGKYQYSLGAITFKYKNADCRAGTGFSDNERNAFWKAHQAGKLVGQVMEVEFTELTGKGRTRHARFIRMRSFDGERN